MAIEPRYTAGFDELYGGIAFAVCAVVLVAFFVGCASLVIPYGIPRTAEDATATFMIGVMAAFVTFPFAAVSALVVGVPLFRLWNRLGFTSLLQYLLAGAVMSAILGATVWLAHFFAGFLSGGSDFPMALWIIIMGGPTASLTVKWAARVGPVHDATIKGSF
jgi:hypothetical protein